MKPEERKAWIEFMVAAMAASIANGWHTEQAARDADRALEEYRKRFPTLPANWQDPAPFV